MNPQFLVEFPQSSVCDALIHGSQVAARQGDLVPPVVSGRVRFLNEQNVRMLLIDQGQAHRARMASLLRWRASRCRQYGTKSVVVYFHAKIISYASCASGLDGYGCPPLL